MGMLIERFQRQSLTEHTVFAHIFVSHLPNGTYLNGGIQIFHLPPVFVDFGYIFKINTCHRAPSLGRSWHESQSVAILTSVPLSIL